MPINSGKSVYLDKAVLDVVLSQAAFPTIATVYIGLLSVMPTLGGVGGTEVSGGSYARVGVTNNATQWPASTTVSNRGQKQNANAIAFPTATANWASGANLQGWGIFDASTSGNLLYYGEFIGALQAYTLNVGTSVFTAAAHGYSNGNAVCVRNRDGADPTGISESATYYIISATTNTFQLSLTMGGSAVAPSDGGTEANYVALDNRQPVLNGNTFTIPSNGLTLTEQ